MPYSILADPPWDRHLDEGDDTAQDRHFSLFDHFYSLYQVHLPTPPLPISGASPAINDVLELQTIRPTRPAYALRGPHYFLTLRSLVPCGKCVAHCIRRPGSK